MPTWMSTISWYVLSSFETVILSSQQQNHPFHIHLSRIIVYFQELPRFILKNAQFLNILRCAQFSISVKGTVLVLGALAAQMATQEPRTVVGRNGPRSVGRGSIVCLSSGNGYCSEPNKGAYTASKHAVMGVMKTAGE